MSITRQDVDRMARLARLDLTEAESSQLQTQLEAIVGYVAVLATVDTDNVRPDIAGSEAVSVERADHLQPSLSTDEALAQAPERMENSFCVPAFMDEG